MEAATTGARKAAGETRLRQLTKHPAHLSFLPGRNKSPASASPSQSTAPTHGSNAQTPTGSDVKGREQTTGATGRREASPSRYREFLCGFVAFPKERGGGLRGACRCGCRLWRKRVRISPSVWRLTKATGWGRGVFLVAFFVLYSEGEGGLLYNSFNNMSKYSR